MNEKSWRKEQKNRRFYRRTLDSLFVVHIVNSSINRTIKQFSFGHLPLNCLLSISAGVIGVMQFVLQKAGEPLMGDFRYISFAVLMSSAVFLSAILGVVLGEWKGTSVKTHLLLLFGVGVLSVGFAVMALGSR